MRVIDKKDYLSRVIEQCPHDTLACLFPNLEATQNLEHLQQTELPRLQRKKTIDNHAKYLKFKTYLPICMGPLFCFTNLLIVTMTCRDEFLSALSSFTLSSDLSECYLHSIQYHIITLLFMAFQAGWLHHHEFKSFINQHLWRLCGGEDSLLFYFLPYIRTLHEINQQGEAELDRRLSQTEEGVSVFEATDTDRTLIAFVDESISQYHKYMKSAAELKNPEEQNAARKRAYGLVHQACKERAAAIKENDNCKQLSVLQRQLPAGVLPDSRRKTAYDISERMSRVLFSLDYSAYRVFYTYMEQHQKLVRSNILPLITSQKLLYLLFKTIDVKTLRTDFPDLVRIHHVFGSLNDMNALRATHRAIKNIIDENFYTPTFFNNGESRFESDPHIELKIKKEV